VNAEIGRIKARNTADVTNAWITVAQRARSLDLQVGSCGRSVQLRIEHACPNRRTISSRQCFNDQLESRTDIALEQQQTIRNSGNVRNKGAVSRSERKYGHPRAGARRGRGKQCGRGGGGG